MFSKYRNVLSVIGSLFIFAACISYSYAREQPDVQVGAQEISPNLHMLWDSRGFGNTALLTGDDGVLMVDAKDGGTVGKLLEKIAELSPKKIRFAINTHWHFDHVGGNAKVAEAGAVIIAHENVRKRMGIAHDMKILNTKVPPSPETARPLITYTKDMTLHLNGEDIRVFQLGPGHTDGDSLVYFQKANVIHMGDLYFEGLYPYIGIYSGGSIDGMIKVINQVLPMIDKDTKVVPGHGPLSNKAKLEEYVSMLTAIRGNVSRLMREGKTMEEVIAAKPTRDFDEKWGEGLLPPDRFAALVYMDLSPELP